MLSAEIEQAEPTTEIPPRASSHSVLLALAIVAITAVVYLPATRCGFIWDDDLWVTNNVLLRSGEGLRRIWADLQSVPEYYPLTLSSFWIEYRFWGLHPAGYHINNIVLHALVAVLLWRVLRRLEVPGAWLAGALVAVHPVNVESVAWVTERKNVLSGAMYLSALLAFLRFSMKASTKPRWPWLACALMLYALAVLAKTVTVTLPGVLLIVLWWKKGKLSWRDIAATLPFFAVGLPLGLLAIWMQKHHTGATGARFDLSFGERVIVAGRAIWFYFGKIIWPTKLTFIYPRWETDPRAWWQYLPAITAFATILGLWFFRKRLGRGTFAGAMIFLVTLFPALGFFNIFWQIYSFVADHVQYIAAMAIIALLAAGVELAISRFRGNAIRVSAYALLLVTLSVLTWRQQAAYRNSETLWRDTLAKNDRAWMAWNNLGSELAAQEKWDEAVACYHRALEINPQTAGAYLNLGLAHEAHGQFLNAIDCYRTALQIQPDYPGAMVNLASAYGQRHEYAMAESLSRQVLEKDPQNAGAIGNLATALSAQGHGDEAIAILTKAIKHDPWATSLRLNLAVQLTMQEQTQEGLNECKEALRRDPQSAQAKQLLGVLEARAAETNRK
jgi:tetratricopeptide (TPR) repeat protein